MEASLRVGVDFQAQVSQDMCSGCLCTVIAGVEPGDWVQIYPYTASGELVAIRKICDNRPCGPFITFPVSKLEMNETQKVHIHNGFGHAKTGSRFNITTVKNSACAKFVKRATGLAAGKKVQFFPYSTDVAIEDNDGVITFSPVIMVAVRKIKKDSLKGPYIMVDITCLNLSKEQKARIWGVINDGLQNFINATGLPEKKARLLFKNFKAEVDLTEEILEEA